MSSTIIYAFGKDGDAYMYGAVPNSFRSGMLIWQLMEERHLPPFIPYYVKDCYWYHNGISAETVAQRLGYKPSRLIPSFTKKTPDPSEEIWNLADNFDVPNHERIVLYTTFDKILVRKENLPRVIEAFRQFDGPTSLPEQADILEHMLSDNNIIAVGWSQTSVAEGWDNKVYDEETEESYPYNCITGTDHHWLFDHYKESEKE